MDLEIAVLEKRNEVSLDGTMTDNNRMRSNLWQRRNLERECSSGDAGDETVDPVAERVRF